MSEDDPIGARPARDEPVRVYGWSSGGGWNQSSRRGRGLPWIGIFLVVFGLLILVDRVVPGAGFAGSAFLLAVGVSMLIAWVANRGTGWLYGGAIVTAIAIPSTLVDLRVISGPGWGTLFLGIAFLGLAAVRAQSGRGTGWQLSVGILLAALGAVQVAVPGSGDLFWPILLVIAGAALVGRGLRRG